MFILIFHKLNFFIKICQEKRLNYGNKITAKVILSEDSLNLQILVKYIFMKYKKIYFQK